MKIMSLLSVLVLCFSVQAFAQSTESTETISVSAMKWETSWICRLFTSPVQAKIQTEIPADQHKAAALKIEDILSTSFVMPDNMKLLKSKVSKKKSKFILGREDHKEVVIKTSIKNDKVVVKIYATKKFIKSIRENEKIKMDAEIYTQHLLSDLINIIK